MVFDNEEPDKFFHREDDVSREFFAIANDLATVEANEYLDKRLQEVDRWVEYRKSINEPADLRSLIVQVLNEPNQRGPVIVALCTAMWRLREKEKAHGDRR